MSNVPNDLPIIPDINPINLITGFIQWFLNLSQQIYNYLFGHIDFAVLWRWLPNDIQAACNALLIIFFALVIWRLLRGLLPF